MVFGIMQPIELKARNLAIVSAPNVTFLNLLIESRLWRRSSELALYPADWT